MIEQLLKSYELFPKQENESDRRLMVYGFHDEFEIRLTVFINDQSHHATEKISVFEYEALIRTDISDVLLKRVCRSLSDYLELKENPQ